MEKIQRMRSQCVPGPFSDWPWRERRTPRKGAGFEARLSQLLFCSCQHWIHVEASLSLRMFLIPVMLKDDCNAHQSHAKGNCPSEVSQSTKVYLALERESGYS